MSRTVDTVGELRDPEQAWDTRATPGDADTTGLQTGANGSGDQGFADQDHGLDLQLQRLQRSGQMTNRVKIDPTPTWVVMQ
jgi:hypothetical protein